MSKEILKKFSSLTSVKWRNTQLNHIYSFNIGLQRKRRCWFDPTKFLWLRIVNEMHSSFDCRFCQRVFHAPGISIMQRPNDSQIGGIQKRDEYTFLLYKKTERWWRFLSNYFTGLYICLHRRENIGKFGRS